MTRVKMISGDQLKDKLDKMEDYLLIDTLGLESYDRLHLPGAAVIDASKDDFLQQVGMAAHGRKDMVVIVYSSFSDKDRSAMAARKLIDAGYTDVSDYPGGIDDWRQLGYMMRGSEAAFSARF